MEKSGIDEALEIDSLRCGLCGRAYGTREPMAIVCVRNKHESSLPMHAS